MKKIAFVLFFLAGFTAHATILLVKEGGVNNTYPTISAAITAAANNDTIVVYDKLSGQPWLESITIDKNLWIIHPTQGTRFKAPGNVTIVPKAGMDLFILGWDMAGFSITATATGSTATSANRAKITVSDCSNMLNLDLRVDWIESRVFYNQTNITGSIYFRHGLAVANVLINGGIYVDQESTVAAQNDSILIIGNKIRSCYVDTKEAGLIANNYIYNDNNAGNWYDWGGGNALSIRYHNQSDSAIFGIYNNTLTNAGGGSGTRMAIAMRNSGKVSNIRIVNNLLYVCGTTSYGLWYDAGGPNVISGNPFISHNFINSCNSNYTNFSTNNELNYNSNAGPGYGTIDTWGRAASGNTTLINKGIYLGEYFDIDLTRNDIGTYGGPYSIDNYLTSGDSKGRMLYINIKHQLTNLNQLLNIKASGGAKF